MRTDAQRQADYQKRRLSKEDRVTFWLDYDTEKLMDSLRGAESRTIWLRRAISELCYRQLLDRKFQITDEEADRVRAHARELGVELPL